MTDLIVRNLPGHIGPGDIVGAFTNEIGMDGKQIGKIDFNSGAAIVEVEDSVAHKAAKIMDNNQIAGIRVQVEVDDGYKEKLKEIKNYTDNYRHLVQLEREEEMRRHEIEIKELSAKQREKKGRAILYLSGRDEGQGFGGRELIKFIRQKKGEKLPDTEISVGDLVMLSKNRPLADNNPTGTVVEKTNYSLTVVFDSNPAGFLYDKGLRLDLYVNDITFQRMLDALGNLESATGRLKVLRDKLLGLADVEFNQLPKIDYYNKDLNDSQRQAVRSALAAKDFFLVHGPPGTGKTMTSIEILQQEAGEKNILATADSNTAVDNLVERLVARGVKVLRVGHPARVNSLVREYTLDHIIQEHPKYKEASQLRDKAYKLSKQQDDNPQCIFPSGENRRGFSNQQIRDLGSKNINGRPRGLSPKKIKGMAKWLELQDEINQLFSQIERLEDEAVTELIEEAEVVCTTNSTAGSEVLAEQNFDLLLIDEATQSTEPAALIPVVKSNKVILVGDHKQLPPTILNEEAARKGLSKSLFERLLEVHGAKIKEILNVQYRMNQAIMNFSSSQFYDQQLVAAKKVKEWNITDLNIQLPKGNSPAEKVLKIKDAVVFLDTSGMSAPEYTKGDSTSLQNRIEAELVSEIINQTVNTKIDLSEVAVITPYKDQVDLIKQLIKLEEVEVNTVDGFQGREKELVILSLVRSNQQDNIGFLRDIRRLNVSLTRAKKKLIILGDSSTITSHETYQSLVEYIEKNGYLYSL
ncbi:DNA helicase, putative [Halobacteroides halobius DSM 5150]|uniref:DNA helicase n=1 Tax=Halobacteroides halobius (strain ATCC 35273 / DSM 5150 / MD-1) TaxID=748449 RepID=L0K7I9_HALHC|nr:IGHMBP2 family helicase [Halobacteroides halobius]AGB40299.1 DNA helicase, putative [Halobacteroides halobius DSM 5150]